MSKRHQPGVERGTLRLGARVTDAVVLGRSIRRMISARHDGLAGSGGVRSLLLCVRKTHPEEVLESHSSGGGAPRVKAVAHVDVGAGGIDGRFTQDRQSK
jgi:hypothetical protein